MQEACGSAWMSMQPLVAWRGVLQTIRKCLLLLLLPIGQCACVCGMDGTVLHSCNAHGVRANRLCWKQGKWVLYRCWTIHQSILSPRTPGYPIQHMEKGMGPFDDSPTAYSCLSSLILILLLTDGRVLPLPGDGGRWPRTAARNCSLKRAEPSSSSGHSAASSQRHRAAYTVRW